jgi:Mrp family chromosome partitioning ATPase
VVVDEPTPAEPVVEAAEANDTAAAERAASAIWRPVGGIDLYRSIYLRSGTAAPGTYALTSTCLSEGKTTVGLGLASAIAQDFPDLRVALVEADFERPALARLLGFPELPGLLECIMAGELSNSVIQRTPLENLSVVVAGGRVENPTRWLSSKRLAPVLEALRATHDVVILDAPVVVANAGAQALVNAADGVLFVVRADATPKARVAQALTHVDPGKLRGVVMNRAHSVIPGWARRLAGL